MDSAPLSQRPYLIRAMHEWMGDNGHTPHIVIDAAVDGVGMGLGFTLALFILGAVREIFGAGALLGFNLFGEFRVGDFRFRDQAG